MDTAYSEVRSQRKRKRAGTPARTRRARSQESSRIQDSRAARAVETWRPGDLETWRGQRRATASQEPGVGSRKSALVSQSSQSQFSGLCVARSTERAGALAGSQAVKARTHRCSSPLTAHRSPPALGPGPWAGHRRSSAPQLSLNAKRYDVRRTYPVPRHLS